MNNVTLASLTNSFAVSLVSCTIIIALFTLFTKNGAEILKTSNKCTIIAFAALTILTTLLTTLIINTLTTTSTETIKKYAQIFGNTIAIVALIIETIKFRATPIQHHSNTPPATSETIQQKISMLTLIAVAAKIACDLFSAL